MEFQEKVDKAKLESLPIKSINIYKRYFEEYKSWTKQNNHEGKETNGDVMLVYFNELSKKYAASTLWSRSTGVRSMLGLDALPEQVGTFLKSLSRAHVPKVSKVFSKEEVEKWLRSKETSNENITAKLATSFAILGALRLEEVTNLMWRDVTKEDDCLKVWFSRGKQMAANERTFFIASKLKDDEAEICPYRLFIDYKVKSVSIMKCNTNLQVRIPESHRMDRLFLIYDPKSNLGWTKRPVGKTFFGNLPNKIAKDLDLPNPELYTGHAFRRTSATILADSGADRLTLKRHGDWKSDTVTEHYLAKSKKLKTEVSRSLIGSTVASGFEAKSSIGSGVSFASCSIANIVIHYHNDVDKK